MRTLLNKTIATYQLGGIEIEARYWMALVIGLLIFLLIFTLARLRYLYVHWNLGKSSLSFLFYGFLLALILEGFLIIGGKTFIIEVIGWKNPPKPISTALDAGREKLVDVLGVQDQIATNQVNAPSKLEDVIFSFEALSFREKEGLRQLICKP